MWHIYTCIYKVKEKVEASIERNLFANMFHQLCWPLNFLHLKQRLLELSYPKLLINNAIERAKLSKTYENEKVDDKLNSTVISFIHTYNPNNPSFFNNVIKPTTGCLSVSNAFKNCTFRQTYRQPRSVIFAQ